MSDLGNRTAERDVGARADYLAAKLRSGELALGRIQHAARLGDQESQDLTGVSASWFMKCFGGIEEVLTPEETRAIKQAFLDHAEPPFRGPPQQALEDLGRRCRMWREKDGKHAEESDWQREHVVEVLLGIPTDLA